MVLTLKIATDPLYPHFVLLSSQEISVLFSGDEINGTSVGNDKECYQDLEIFCEELSRIFPVLS